MLYAPHILQVKVITPPDKDEYNQSIPGTGGESWQDVCRCRCDDNSTKEFTGKVYMVKNTNYLGYSELWM